MIISFIDNEWRVAPCKFINPALEFTNAVVKNVACYNQTGNWTASTNVTISATDRDGDILLMLAHSLDGTDRQVAGADVLTLASAEKGDMVHMICDGTSYYINAWVADDGHAALA